MLFDRVYGLGLAAAWAAPGGGAARKAKRRGEVVLHQQKLRELVGVFGDGELDLTRWIRVDLKLYARGCEIFERQMAVVGAVT